MKIEAVIFDLGETLLIYGPTDANRMFRRGAKLTYQYLQGLETNNAVLPTFASYYRRHIFTIRLRYLWSNVVNREFDCMALLDRKARGMGFHLTARQLEELAWLWYRPLGESAAMEPDLTETLAALQAMSLKLGIISNTFLPGAVLDRQLEQLGILSFFPVRIYSSDTIYRKPDRRIYAAALERLAVPAECAVMVGDKMREDIRGAQKTGLRSILLKGEMNRTIYPGDKKTVQIHALAELPALIRRWGDEGG